ncbi:substrate-binding periplasmic protein [Salinibius halmophilus]|uniref:substrate-binding periplasmic protein n=1 Tax=Salinibius halmophilus TaxID=1853216 RepID=UPI00131407DB|nr:ABC transporter substrate-binding protein [Salinibius halmophilus]
MKFVVATLSAVTLSYAQAQSLPEQITLAATDWCPFTCAAAQNGKVETKLRRYFSRLGVTLTVEYYPWVRAVTLAEQGDLDGVVTLSEGESDVLVHGDVPIHYYQDCFYTRQESDWQYHNINDLTDMKLGSVDGYSYSREIDSYIRDYPRNGAQISGVNTVPRLMGMLESGNVDAIIAEKSIAQLWLPTYKIQQSTCLTEQPLYVAFNPNRTWVNLAIEGIESQLGYSKR